MDRDHPEYRESDDPEAWIARRTCKIYEERQKSDSPARAVADHRREVAHLYDMFLHWLCDNWDARGDILIRASGP